MDKEQDLIFDCERCGSCCRNLDGIEACANMDRGDGVCKYYNNETRECIIYDFRPDICNLSKHYLKKYKNKMTWEEYVEQNKEGCKTLQEYEKNKK